MFYVTEITKFCISSGSEQGGLAIPLLHFPDSFFLFTNELPLLSSFKSLPPLFVLQDHRRKPRLKIGVTWRTGFKPWILCMQTWHLNHQCDGILMEKNPEKWSQCLDWCKIWIKILMWKFLREGTTFITGAMSISDSRVLYNCTCCDLK